MLRRYVYIRISIHTVYLVKRSPNGTNSYKHLLLHNVYKFPRNLKACLDTPALELNPNKFIRFKCNI